MAVKAATGSFKKKNFFKLVYGFLRLNLKLLLRNDGVKNRVVKENTIAAPELLRKSFRTYYTKDHADGNTNH